MKIFGGSGALLGGGALSHGLVGLYLNPALNRSDFDIEEASF